MLGRLVRFGSSRIGRSLLVVLLLLLIWTFWWFSPRWPEASYSYDAAIGGRLETLINFAGNIVCEFRGQRNTSKLPRGWAIINLASGKTVAKQEIGIGEWKQSPKGEILVAADDSGWQVIDVKTGRTITRTDSEQLAAAPNARIQFSADGRRFAVESNGIAIFDATNARLVQHFPNHCGPFDLDANGVRLMAKPTNGKSLELLNVESGQTIVSLHDIEPMKYLAVKFSPYNKFIAICTEKDKSADSTDQVHVWSIDDQRRLVRFPLGTTESVAKQIWFGSNDRFLVVRDISSHLIDLAAKPPADLTPWLAGPNRQFDHSEDGSVFLVSSMTHWSVYDSGNEMPMFQRRKFAMSWPGLSADGQTAFMIHRDTTTQSRGLIAFIQKFLGRNSFDTYSAQFVDVETGRDIMTLNNRYPFCFDRPNNQVWTQQIREGATPGTYKTILEKWELRRDNVPVWLYLVSVFAFFLFAIGAHSKGRPTMRLGSSHASSPSTGRHQ